MAEDFRVVPDALVRLATALRKAADSWNSVASTVDGMRMGALDLGMLGEARDYPTRYNTIKDQVHDVLDDGVTVWQDMATAMDAVAQTYLAKDAEWYERFGYLADSQN